MDWFAPAVASDRSILARWSAAVGPPVMRGAPSDDGRTSDTLIVVSWNIALGAGDVSRALRDARSADPDAHVILLLQEAYRGGPEVPAGALDGVRFAGKLGDAGTHRREIESIAEAEGLDLYYVPSMRNGSPLASDEDRGNAILSTLPLRELGAIELPFERQRRVAVAATVSGRARDGSPWRLRVVSTHLDNMVGANRGWIFGGESARTRQARALLEHLKDEDAVVFGGDFNTWFGFNETATAEIGRAFPDSDLHDRRPTFMSFLRLDHLFFRFPEGWRGEVRRADDRYGSDHYPLIAAIDLGRDAASGAVAELKLRPSDARR
jgi:endonuclease/exonuclease/phosphatase family metal-dependent hydrolase